jgi:hypothetical protein
MGIMKPVSGGSLIEISAVCGSRRETSGYGRDIEANGVDWVCQVETGVLGAMDSSSFASCFLAW